MLFRIAITYLWGVMCSWKLGGPGSVCHSRDRSVRVHDSLIGSMLGSCPHVLQKQTSDLQLPIAIKVRVLSVTCSRALSGNGIGNQLLPRGIGPGRNEASEKSSAGLCWPKQLLCWRNACTRLRPPGFGVEWGNDTFRGFLNRLLPAL